MPPASSRSCRAPKNRSVAETFSLKLRIDRRHDILVFVPALMVETVGFQLLPAFIDRCPIL
jgi:hypothetical protein